MKPTAPCKDCEDRHSGCHSECEKYKAFKEESLQYNLELGKIYGANVYFDNKAAQNASRRKHRRR